VIGGTINGTGALVITAEKIGADTMLSRIVHMVAKRSAAAPYPTTRRLGGSLVRSRRHGLAAITFVAWMIWAPAPALGLAVVAAVSVAHHRVPVRTRSRDPDVHHGRRWQRRKCRCSHQECESLERFEKVDTLVIDKTGTLTEGKPRVTAVVPRLASTNPLSCRSERAWKG